MRKHEMYTEYHDHFEYFGNTEIERIRKQGEKTIRHDWIIFDSVDEAMEYFNDRCGEFVGYYAWATVRRSIMTWCYHSFSNTQKSVDVLELSVIQSITAAILYDLTTPICFGGLLLESEVTIVTMSRSGYKIINCPPVIYTHLYHSVQRVHNKAFILSTYNYPKYNRKMQNWSFL